MTGISSVRIHKTRKNHVKPEHNLSQLVTPIHSICIDHMRRTHKVPLSVKMANLSKYFPAWTVTREQWADMLMPSISGVAIDTLLFSRIGSPRCHRYRLISWTGSHTAFRGTYLHRLRAFLDESDSVVVRRLHSQLAQELASCVVRRVGNLDLQLDTGLFLGHDDHVA